jgi:hypothetical protein
MACRSDSAVLWLVDLQIRRGRKVQTQVHAVIIDSQTANWQYSLFSKKKEKYNYAYFLHIRVARRPN